MVIPKDRATGNSRGFAFVEFGADEHAELAIQVYDGRPLGGRPLRVRPAEDRAPRRPVAPPAELDFGFDGGTAARHQRGTDEFRSKPRRNWREERGKKRAL